MELLILSHWICFAASCSVYPQIQDYEEAEPLAIEDGAVDPPSAPYVHPPVVPIALESSEDETALDSEAEGEDIPASNEAVAGSTPDDTSAVESLLAECDEHLQALKREEREKELQDLQDEREALLYSQDTSMAPEVARALFQEPDEEPRSWDVEDKKQDLHPSVADLESEVSGGTGVSPDESAGLVEPSSKNKSNDESLALLQQQLIHLKRRQTAQTLELCYFWVCFPNFICCFTTWLVATSPLEESTFLRRRLNIHNMI